MDDSDNPQARPIPQPVPFGPKAHSQEIDSLRAIAAFLVFLFHADGVVASNEEKLRGVCDLLQSFVVTGATGVTLFFIISGFLLSMQFLKKPNNDTMLFYKKRIIRIMPIYWLIVTIAGLVTGVAFADPLKVVRSYLFLFGGWDLFPFNAPWWTLRTEIQFYLLLPLILPLIHFRKGRWIIAAMIILYIPVMFIGMHVTKGSGAYYYFMQSAIRHAPTFGMGILVAWIYTTHGPSLSSYFKSRKVFSNGLSDILMVLAFVLLSLVLREVSLHGGTLAVETGWPQRFVCETIPWSLILMGVILLPLRLKPMLSNRCFCWFGEISYPFYFVHLPLLYYVKVFFSSRINLQKGWNQVTFEIVACSFVLAVIISFAMNRLIERPIVNYKNNLGS